MSTNSSKFPAGIDFESVLRIISKQVYETPLAFIRENVQNAVDAIRIQAYRDGIPTSDDRYRVDVSTRDMELVVRDNGVGMSAAELQSFFWTIGASGKRTKEALLAGCVGSFGIGGFANFGVCRLLEVVSQTQDADNGTLTRLSESDIREAGASIPSVTIASSLKASPRGTVVTGHLRKLPNVDQLRNYLLDFVRFVPVDIFFNKKRISKDRFSDIENRENYTTVEEARRIWSDNELSITGRLVEDRGHTLVVLLENLSLDGKHFDISGNIRFENGTIDVFKHGFKLCGTSVGSTIGVTGRLDCELFAPTAGRDSPDAATTSLLARIVRMLERVAVETVLKNPDRVAQHTRIFRYVVRHGLIGMLRHVRVQISDGTEFTLGEIREKVRRGAVGVFFGLAKKHALNQIMQARGHIVVLLSSDRYRRDAERAYLQQYCAGKPFDGIIDCIEHYDDLSRFEKVFLSELELNISRSYEINDFRIVAGRLTEDIPVFLKEHSGGQPPDVFVNVRHPEITKLASLGFTSILYSLIATFCREYLGPSLKKWSPRFFGDGALNLDLLAKRRSDLWILVKDDVGIVRKGGQRHIVTRSDVHEVRVGRGQESSDRSSTQRPPRILHIIEEEDSIGVDGYYIRVPDSAYRAYGDLLPQFESRGLVWAGNRVLYVLSDGIGSAFQYEIRLDELIVVSEIDGIHRAEGAVELKQQLQENYGGLYFPIPQAIESYIVPMDRDQEIRIYLYCEWIDMRTAKHWLPREVATGQ